MEAIQVGDFWIHDLRDHLSPIVIDRSNEGMSEIFWESVCSYGCVDLQLGA